MRQGLLFMALVMCALVWSCTATQRQTVADRLLSPPAGQSDSVIVSAAKDSAPLTGKYGDVVLMAAMAAQNAYLLLKKKKTALPSS